jgi:hypothetical protein
MQRIGRPLLTGVLVWLLVLSSGASPGRALACAHRSGPGGTPHGHRHHVPARRGAPLPRQDELVQLSHLFKRSAQTTKAPGLIPPCPTPPRAFCLVPPGRGSPLYLILCTFLL